MHYGPLSLKYKFKLEFSRDKHTIDLEFHGCGLQLGCDPNYFNEMDSGEKIWHSSGQSGKMIKNITGADIEKILEGKVVHPAIHQHIDYNNFPHCIRIAAAAKNPFLFLYQLAFQLCDCYNDFKSSTAKQVEFKRLNELFFEYFKKSGPKKGYKTISPGNLFNL